MLTGRIVRFDRVRGYGFIAPDKGGEDVFIHANDLEADEAAASVGSRVEFDVVEGERGLKAYDVRLLGKGTPPVTPANGSADDVTQVANGVRTATPVPQAIADEDEEWDVMGEQEFVSEVTELLLQASPTLTAAHIKEVRHALVGMARAHGWIE